MSVPRPTDRFVAQNRKARHDYFIEDTVEVGLALLGSEVKSLRQGQASIAEAHAREQDGEFYLVNSFIPEYPGANRFNHEPRRLRKLLLKRKEMDRLFGSIKRLGITLIPLSIYFNARGFAKLELGIAKGKRKEDKRAAEKDRDWQLDRARILRRGNE